MGAGRQNDGSSDISASRVHCRVIIILLPDIDKIKKSPLADTHKFLNTTLRQRHIEVIDCLTVPGMFNVKSFFFIRVTGTPTRNITTPWPGQ